MKIFKKSRYYVWLISGFIRKYSKLMVIFFIIAFFALFFSKSFVDFFRPLFLLNKEKIGVLKQSASEQIPREILQQVSSSIVAYDKHGQFKPGIAKRWQIKKQGQVYYFYFPKTLKWQDGTPFKVGDIDKSFIEFREVTTELIGDYTLKFTLKKPLSSFPSILTTPVLKHNLVGINGLYKIARIKYEFGELKNVHLLPRVSGEPYLIYKVYHTAGDLILAYKLGEVDRLTTRNREALSEFSNWRNTSLNKTVDYRQIITLFINTSKAPFDNKNLRAALALGIDYDQLLSFGEKALSPIPPFSWAFNLNVKEIRYEPEISASVVGNSHLDDSPITLTTSYELANVAERLRKSLEKAGFNIEIRYLSYIPTDYELFLTIWEPPVDPDQYVFWHQTQTSGNFSKLKNVKIDKLLEDGRNEISITKRKQIYADFQEVIMEELPALFLIYPHQYTIERAL